jgi:hypothetical protein
LVATWEIVYLAALRPMRIAGIQPGYLPWLGFFDQMLRVDAFVIADELQFTTSGWTHRNRVRGPHGAHWLTVPTRRRQGQAIRDVEIDDAEPWRKDHLRTLGHFYGASPHARGILERLARAVEPGARLLADVSVATIRLIAAELRIATPLVRSSELHLERSYAELFPERPGPTHRIIAYMKALGADELIEGETGRAYLDVDLCARHGVAVRFHHFEHPVYAQLHEPFVSHLSAIDLLLVHGADDACAVLRAARAELR